HAHGHRGVGRGEPAAPPGAVPEAGAGHRGRVRGLTGPLGGHCYARPEMPIVVQKYGGTSVDGVERLRAVADRVVKARDEGSDVIVVVSAMGQTTDDLARMAKDIASEPDLREMDMLLTAGGGGAAGRGGGGARA